MGHNLTPPSSNTTLDYLLFTNHIEIFMVLTIPEFGSREYTLNMKYLKLNNTKTNQQDENIRKISIFENI